MCGHDPPSPAAHGLGKAHGRGTSSRTRVPRGAGADREPATDRRRALAHERDAEMPFARARVVGCAQAAAVVLHGQGQATALAVQDTTSARAAWRSTLASASPSTRNTTAAASAGRLDRGGPQLDGQPALARALPGRHDRVV